MLDLRRVRRGLTSWWPSTSIGRRAAWSTVRRGVSPDAVALMQQILGGGLAAALDEPVTAATWEVDHLATRPSSTTSSAASGR